MKTIKILLLLACTVFDLLSCVGNSCMPPKYNDFDWENCNEVQKVYYELAYFECSDPRIRQYDGKTIKLTGWLRIDNNKITITSDPLGTGWGILINCTSELLTTIDAYDLTLKCCLKGELKLEKTSDGKGSWCCQMGIHSVTLKSMDDIYFEEEEK